MKIILSIFLLAMSNFVFSESYLDCSDKQQRADSIGNNESTCLISDIEKMDEKLSNYYKNLISDLNLASERKDQNPAFRVSVKDAIPKIKKSQTIWLALLETDCKLYPSNISRASDKVARRMHYQCKLDASKERLKFLKSLRDGWLP